MLLCLHKLSFPCMIQGSHLTSLLLCSLHALHPAELHGRGEQTGPKLHLYSQEARDQYTERWTVSGLFIHFLFLYRSKHDWLVIIRKNQGFPNYLHTSSKIKRSC